MNRTALLIILCGFCIINSSPLRSLESSDVFYQAHRFYEPQLSRFVSPDTMMPNPLKSQALNRYAYTYNNPLKYRDPSGHVPVGSDWLDRIISGFFGNRSKPPPSGYRGSPGGHSRASDMGQRAWESQSLNSDTVQLAAGAAVAAREVEIKTSVSWLAGSADLFYYVDPFTYGNAATRNNGELQPPSETLFAVVDLDLSQEPGYKIPYYTGVATGAGLVVVPAALAIKYGLTPKTAPAPNPGPRPTPQPRKPPHSDPSHPDYPPVFVGGNNSRNLPDPSFFKRFEPGSRVRILFSQQNPSQPEYAQVIGPASTTHRSDGVLWGRQISDVKFKNGTPSRVSSKQDTQLDPDDHLREAILNDEGLRESNVDFQWYQIDGKGGLIPDPDYPRSALGGG